MIQDIGIEKFEPPVNEEVRKLKGINIHPDFTPTDIESQDGTIEKVFNFGQISCFFPCGNESLTITSFKYSV